MGTTLSLVAITATLCNVTFVFAECKCDGRGPDDPELKRDRFPADFEANLHDVSKCIAWKATYGCSWVEECKCELPPDAFNDFDLDQSACLARHAAPHSCHWIYEGAHIPDAIKIHKKTPDHCVMTAHWAVAVNLGKIPARGTGAWTPGLWNTRATEIDKYFEDIDDRKFTRKLKHTHAKYERGESKSYKLEKEKGSGKWKRPKKFIWKKVKGKKGAFATAFAQMMLETVGLNYGEYLDIGDITETEVSYPHYNYGEGITRTDETIYNKNALRFTRDVAERAGTWTQDTFTALFNGRAKFLNSRGEIKKMRALVLGINSAPFHTMSTADHVVAVVPLEGTWHYLDSNEPTIQTLEVNDDGTFKDITLSNVYQKPGLFKSPVTYTNRIDPDTGKCEVPENGWKNGYLVDPSINLGNNIGVVARWVYDKCMVRPHKYEGETGGPRFIPDEFGGAVYWQVIVDDDPPKEWDDIKTRYKDMIKTTGTMYDKIESEKEFVFYQREDWAHVGYEEHNDLHWNKENDEEEEEFDADRDDAFYLDSYSKDGGEGRDEQYDDDHHGVDSAYSHSLQSDTYYWNGFVVGGLFGGTTVVVIVLVFCVGVACGMIGCKCLYIQRNDLEKDQSEAMHV
eukprot:46702_1